MSISNNCMIVNLRMGVWNGYKLDRSMTQKVTDEAGAASDAARVNKHLIDKVHLKPVNTASAAIRHHFYTNTLPWRDNGDRVLTRPLFRKFRDEHQLLKDKFRDEVLSFLKDKYSVALAQAEFRMGDMYNPDDYPSVADLKHRFYIELDISPVSEANDFRVKLSKDEVAEVRESIELATNANLRRAMADVWQRLYEKVEHFATKMKGDEVFRNSTVENLREIVEVIPNFNITGDENLEAMRQKVLNTLTGYEADTLREQDDVRSEAAKQAEKIMKQMNGFMKAFGGAN